MKISFCSIAFRHQKISLAEIFRKIASSGYQQVELWSGHLRNISAEEVNAYLKDSSLKAVVLSPYFDFTNGDRSWKNSLLEVRRYIDFARRLNCPFIRCFTGKKGSQKANEKNWRDGLEGIKITADLACQYNINIVIETHRDTLADSYWSIDRLLKGINRPNVGINFDIFNLWEGADDFTLSIFRKLFPYIKHIHLKNARQKTHPSSFSLVHHKNADLSHICLLEEGKLNLEPYLKYLKENNYQGTLSVEWFGGNIEEAAKRDLSYLKTIFDYNTDMEITDK